VNPSDQLYCLGGAFEFQIPRLTSQELSGCFRHIVMTFPVSDVAMA
jgi:hypothetical protein